MDKYYALDTQLRSIADSLTEEAPILSAVTLDRSRLASALGQEIAWLFDQTDGNWDELVEELNLPVSLKDRRGMMIGYFQLMQVGDIGTPALDRARIVTQLYFDLIYFRDATFRLIGKKLHDSGIENRVPNVREWMKLFGDSDYWERLRNLRNAFAHGRWAFLPDFSGIVCYPQQKAPFTPHLWTQSNLSVAHALLYCLQCVFFEEVQVLFDS